MTGAEVGLNANDLEGCFDLSNPLTVIRQEAVGGELTLADTTVMTSICAGDGIEDPLDIILTGNSGDNSAWVITDTTGNILGLPTAPPFDLEGAGPGVCLIWHLSFADGLEGAEVGQNANDLSGCFSLSNPLTIIREEAVGGDLSFADGSTEVEICAGDGIADPLEVTLEGNLGSNSAWVITDTNGEILDLPSAPPFDLEGAGSGTCLIWHLSFADGLEGAEIGSNAEDLSGCFDLSNPITVVRIGVNGGELSLEDGETQITICADDGEPDPLNVILENSEGSNMQWVITDLNGIILGLPAAPPFDLEGTGAGVCLLWNLSFEDGLEGAELGLNANNLVGCHDLSNPITITRIIGEACDLLLCEAEGGMIMLEDSSTVVTICAGDSIPDPLNILLEGNIGENSAWVVTDTDANILALPDSLPIDLDGAGEGICLIWHLSYDDGLEGLEVGNNATQLDGCFDLSNPITVDRVTGEDCDGLNCEAEGGLLTFADGSIEVTICAGDSIPDPLDIILEGEVGMNSAWVITDLTGNILGLPAAPPFDLDDAGTGVCLIWHLSFDDGLMGAEVGNNANDLDGCFDLSNPISVTRVSGADCNNIGCEVEGGLLTTIDGETEIEICAGDSIPDPIDVILDGQVGDSSGWIITDVSFNILALPNGPPFDLDGAGPGVCLIWHISYNDTLTGLEVGMNAINIEGCYELSNQITVTRYEGANCQMIGCMADGGTIMGPDTVNVYETCSGDGIADLIDVTVENNMGSNSQWIITDAGLNILDLPDAPPFDFEGAPSGACLIWHLSYEEGIEGLSTGSNAGDLAGCFDLSNSLTVIRRQVDGGEIIFDNDTTAVEICVGDTIADPLDVFLNNAIGDSTQWVITDTLGMILSLPDTPPFDLNDAPAGTCLIWHLSYNDTINGLEEGALAADLEGCFSLSNPLTVVRVEGDDCDDGLVGPGKDVNFLMGPNPANDLITITITDLPFKKGTSKIYNNQGKMINLKEVENGDRMILDITSYNSGLYYVIVQSGSAYKIKKFIKLE